MGMLIGFALLLNWVIQLTRSTFFGWLFYWWRRKFSFLFTCELISSLPCASYEVVWTWYNSIFWFPGRFDKYAGNKIWSYYHSPFSSDLHTEPENRYIVLGCIFMTIQLELPVWPSLKIILSLHNPCVIVFGTKPWSFPFSWKSIFPLSFVFSVTETVTRPLHYFCQPAQLTQYTKQSES